MDWKQVARAKAVSRATYFHSLSMRNPCSAMNSGFRHSICWKSRQFGFDTARLPWPRRVCQPLSQPHFAKNTHRTSRNRLAVRTITGFRDKMTPEDSQFEHFFRYTSGRWLWDEEQQLRDRYKAFDVSRLQTVAAQAVGSDSCASITKLAEGGFNKVFRLIMNDGKTVLARIPNPNAGPPFYTTASEVASMEFVSSPNRAEHER